MNIADLTNPDTNPLPEEVRELVAALIEGRVHSLLILAEITDESGEASIHSMYELDMDENISNEFAFVGALGLLHRQVQEEIDPPTFRIQITGSPDDDDENIE